MKGVRRINIKLVLKDWIVDGVKAREVRLWEIFEPNGHRNEV